jgi:hypothetical protein
MGSRERWGVMTYIEFILRLPSENRADAIPVISMYQAKLNLRFISYPQAVDPVEFGSKTSGERRS